MLSKELHQRWLEHQILANEERAQRLCGRIPRARVRLRPLDGPKVKTPQAPVHAAHG